MSTSAIDLSAAVTLNLRLRAATGAALRVTVTRNGTAVDLTGAKVWYRADLITPIIKAVGSGITLTDAANGVFTLAFNVEDTAAQNTNQQGEHECKVQLSGEAVAVVWEGTLSLEQTLITDLA